VQTGIIAAPISYEVDGVQYVAVVAGTGGSWGVIGGATNMKGYALPNISRLLVYRLGGTAELPPARAFERPPMAPPPATASEETIAMGAPLYERHCGSCHGAGVVGTGILPDLRRSSYLHDPEAWAQVVIGGARERNGNASFAPVLNAEQGQAVRDSVVLRPDPGQ